MQRWSLQRMRTALHVAVLEGDVERARWLIDHGAKARGALSLDAHARGCLSSGFALLGPLFPENLPLPVQANYASLLGPENSRFSRCQFSL
jgi:hypothetical protein